ncbi:glycosyltransferase family 2 protein [Cryobacterium algoricola]|nr:glycosyltransferase family A protein [Cryobacterium algoricola]
MTSVDQVIPDGDLKNPSALADLFDQLLREPNIDKTFSARLMAARECLTVGSIESEPFLSVLLRTQGRRIEPLKDALLCLAAQSDQDFEVIVIDHDADKTAAAHVRRIVAEQEPTFRDRIRVIEVKGGGRSAPLNAGVAAARGEYLSVFDDDDLIFGHWVEEFHVAAGRASGRMLRAVSATQRVRPEVWPHDELGFRTLSNPHAEYAQSFDFFDHLRVNHSPFMSLAFPRMLFSVLGLAFNDELSVCEDWDLILRGSSLAGVDDIEALTSIYRRWEGGNSSYTDHSINSWRESERRVLGGLNDSALLMPPGSVTRVRELLEVQAEGQNARLQLIHLTHSREWRWTRPLRVLLRMAARGKRLLRRLTRRGTAAGKS